MARGAGFSGVSRFLGAQGRSDSQRAVCPGASGCDLQEDRWVPCRRVSDRDVRELQRLDSEGTWGCSGERKADSGGQSLGTREALVGRGGGGAKDRRMEQQERCRRHLETPTWGADLGWPVMPVFSGPEPLQAPAGVSCHQRTRPSARLRGARLSRRHGRLRSLARQVGVAPACRALGVSRSTFYRRARPAPGQRQPRPTPARALSEVERKRVEATLASPRFVDRSPGEVVATLLDEGRYLCSERTMYRILEANLPVKDRRNQRVHPQYAKPELVATAPNQVWSWYITELDPVPWTPHSWRRRSSRCHDQEPGTPRSTGSRW